MGLLSREKSTILRGIAITLVVLCHVINHYNRYFTPLGGIGVTIFLIISGYGLNESYKKNGLEDYWKKRVLSVFLANAIVEIVTFKIRGNFSVISFIKDLTLISPQNPNGWYLNYLLLWYVTFWVIKKRHFSKEYILFISVSLGYGIWFFFTSAIRFEQTFSFVAGIYLSQFIAKNKKSSYTKVLVLLFISLSALVIKQMPVIRDSLYTNYLMESLDLIIKTTAAWSIIEYVINISRTKMTPFMLIGKLSYEIYLCHSYALSVFYTEHSQIWIISSFVLITVMSTVILYYVVNVLLKPALSNIH